MRKSIVVRMQLEGLHSWPEAKDVFPEVGFLSDPHRHRFFIEVRKEVSHNDRDIEIIMFKRSIERYLTKQYYQEGVDCLNFGRMSCEDIAEELMIRFGAEFVQVLEDNENGAIIER